MTETMRKGWRCHLGQLARELVGRIAKGGVGDDEDIRAELVALDHFQRLDDGAVRLGAAAIKVRQVGQQSLRVRLSQLGRLPHVELTRP